MTPWVVPGDDDDEDDGEREGRKTLDARWMFKPSIIAGGWLSKIRTVIEGTRLSDYLGGNYEGREGRVLTASSGSLQGVEDTCMVQFSDGEERSMLSKYVRSGAVRFGEEVLVVKDSTGEVYVAIVREKPEDDEGDVVVSSKDNPTMIESAPRWSVLPLWES